ncbi:MAG: hypothetical protein ACHREM_33635, partial [Polyangiales bacterium]
MKKLAQAVLLSVVLVAPACTPSPEKVCAKMAELLEKDDEISKFIKDKDKFKEDCVKEAAKQKEKDADKYKSDAKCIMDAKDFKDAGKCVEKSKKKGGDDD